MTKDNLKNAWNKTHREFLFPLLAKPSLDERLDDGMDTAHFDFTNNQVRISKQFVNELVSNGMDEETALKALLDHEVGHYIFYPRNLAELIYVGHLSKEWFKEYHKNILGLFLDVKDNTAVMLREEQGKALRNLYKTMHRMTKKEDPVMNVINAYYQHQTGEDLEVKLSDSVQEEALEKLKSIDFLSKEHIEFQLGTFGDAIKDLMPKKENNYSGCPLEIFGPGDFTKEQIDDALDELIKRYGMRRFGKIKEYVESEIEKKIDTKEFKKQSSKGIGAEITDLNTNDNLIPYYERWAKANRVYIIKKPITVNKRDPFPEENIPYNVGSEHHRLNPFSSGGLIIPGVTKQWKDAFSTRKDKEFKVPDLFLWIDSSGSMPHPENDSPAVKAGAMLINNYHKNESDIGVCNFSGSSAFLFPTRDLTKAYSMLCAYHGGGTTMDLEGIKKYMNLVSKKGKQIRGAFGTSEKEMERFYEILPEDKKKELTNKDLSVDLNKEVKQTYEKMDNILITDGGISNLNEVIEYMNSTAEFTRNTIIVYDDPKAAEEWQSLTTDNTQIISAETAEDLYKMTIGKAKNNLIKQSNKPINEFYKK